MNKAFDKVKKIFYGAKSKMEASVLLRRGIVAILCVAVVACSAGIAVLAVSLSIKASVSDRVIAIENAAELEDVDLILVLGAGLRPDGSPSDMLADRILVSVDLIEKGFCDTVLMSGDNSGEHYNEVAAMSLFARERGVSEDNILADGKGYSTYESVFRAIKEYGAERIVIVTQEYHLYRALYIAKALGVEAYGVSADLRTYRGQTYRNLREHVARFKDFLLTIEKD